MDPEVARVAACGPPQDRRSPLDVAAAEIKLTCQQQESGAAWSSSLGSSAMRPNSATASAALLPNFARGGRHGSGSHPRATATSTGSCEAARASGRSSRTPGPIRRWTRRAHLVGADQGQVQHCHGLVGPCRFEAEPGLLKASAWFGAIRSTGFVTRMPLECRRLGTVRRPIDMDLPDSSRRCPVVFSLLLKDHRIWTSTKCSLAGRSTYQVA